MMKQRKIGINIMILQYCTYPIQFCTYHWYMVKPKGFNIGYFKENNQYLRYYSKETYRYTKISLSYNLLIIDKYDNGIILDFNNNKVFNIRLYENI